MSKQNIKSFLIVDYSIPFATGVNVTDYSIPLATGVNVTSGSPWAVIISANFWKN